MVSSSPPYHWHRFREKAGRVKVIQHDLYFRGFLVLYHGGSAKTGAPLNWYDRFANVEQAKLQCSTQMAERSVKQKREGVFYSVGQRFTGSELQGELLALASRSC
jgi:hypothetical protein